MLNYCLCCWLQQYRLPGQFILLVTTALPARAFSFRYTMDLSWEQFWWQALPKNFAPIKVCSKEILAAHAVHVFSRFTLKQKKDHVANTVNCPVIPSSTAYQVLYMHYLFGISFMPICKLLMYTRSDISYSTESACLPCAYYKIFVACFTYENLSNEIYSMKMCCNKLSVFTTCWGLMECYHGSIWWAAFGGLLL